MKQPITDETLFDEFVEKIEWNQEAVAMQNPYSPAQIVSMAYTNIKNAGYIMMIVDNGLETQGSRKPGGTSRLTLLEPSRRPEYHQGPLRPKAMQRTCTPHKPMRHISPILSRTTPWRHWILQRLHKPTEPQLLCWRRRSWSYRANSLPSLQNSWQRNPRTPIWKNLDMVRPWPITSIRRPEIRPHQIRTWTKTVISIQRADIFLTVMGTAPLMATRRRKLTRPQVVSSQKMSQQIGNATGHQGREDMEQGVYQQRAYRVRRGRIR